MILNKIADPTKKKGRPKGSKNKVKQVMFKFRCPVCGGIAKCITKNAEFFCGMADHKGTPMEYIK